MTEPDTLHYQYGRPLGSGVLKANPEDFFVAEQLGFDADGEGEQILLLVRKVGCNTPFVAEHLARFAKLPARAVSYAGLKDRHAITEQWFCLHLPGKYTPDFNQFSLDGCQILRVARHKRKLRIGHLRGNTFRLVLRQISQADDVEQRLQLIAKEGVPNYFGVQRFGRQGHNLVQAERWGRGDIQVKERGKRSFYLSAARSALFNHIASARLAQYGVSQVIGGDALQLTGRGSWFVAQTEELAILQQRVFQGELQITAPLPGSGELGTQAEAREFEQQQLQRADANALMALLQRERVESARRALRVVPQDMHWIWLDNQRVELGFSLPAGCFATSVVRELFQQEGNHEDIAE